MKRLLVSLVLLAGLVLPVFAADPVEGFWISVDDKTRKVTAGWEIYVEGGKLYGRICSVAGYPQDAKAEVCKESYKGFPVAGKVNQMTVVGTPWIFGLSLKQAGKWSGGSIIDPNNGDMYQCVITFHAADGKRYKVDTLEMRGEIGLGIGRSQFWKKSTRAEASGLR
jgi:uncharacterized protein (DUF2147 family)